MKSLDKKIEEKKEDLNAAINVNGVMDKHTIRISQKLDMLIVKRMRRYLNVN